MTITFMFCQRMFRMLIKTKKGFGFKTLGRTILECINIRKIIQDEHDSGFTEIYVRNGEGLQKKITLPSKQ